MTEMVVKIACSGAATIDIDDCNEFQGDLKILTQSNMEKLKREILKLGFSEPVSIWKHDGKSYLLNGHQRVKALRNMRTEGYVVPPIPCAYIEASSVREAKEKVLALTSQYGQITEQGLADFIEESGIEFEEVEQAFQFPEIDFREMSEKLNPPDFQPDQTPESKLDEIKPLLTQCPKCENQFDAKKHKIDG